MIHKGCVGVDVLLVAFGSNTLYLLGASKLIAYMLLLFGGLQQFRPFVLRAHIWWVV